MRFRPSPYFHSAGRIRRAMATPEGDRPRGTRTRSVRVQRSAARLRNWCRKKLAEIANHSFIDPKSGRTLVKELAKDLLRDDRINGRKSLPDVEARWRLQLSKEFGDLPGRERWQRSNDALHRSEARRGNLKRDNQPGDGSTEADVHSRCAGEKGLCNAQLSTSLRTERPQGLR